MSRIFTLFIFALILTACGSTKFRAPVSEDKPLFAAINELIKRPDNSKAQSDLRYFFDQAVSRHEEAVAVYQNSADPSRWDRILNELNALQSIYTATQAIPNATNYIQPKNYLAQLQSTREQAAEFYWEQGMDNFEAGDRQSSLRAYKLFLKANNYVKNFKDASVLAEEAWENSIIDIVVLPVRENYPAFFREWDPGQRYRSDYFQEQLVREMGGRTASYYPARFFTDIEVNSNYIRPEWELEVKWDYVNTTTSTPSTNRKEVSKNVLAGNDSTGKPVYILVKATIITSTRSISARGSLSYALKTVREGRTIDMGTVSDNVSWTESSITYTGDKRALSDEELKTIKALSFDRGPSKTEVMEALVRKMFPDIKRRLERSLSS